MSRRFALHLAAFTVTDTWRVRLGAPGLTDSAPSGPWLGFFKATAEMAAQDWVPFVSALSALVISVRGAILEWRKLRAMPRKRKTHAR